MRIELSKGIRQLRGLLTTVAALAMAAHVTNVSAQVVPTPWGDDQDPTIGELLASPDEPAATTATTRYFRVEGSAFLPVYSDTVKESGALGCVYVSGGASDHRVLTFPVTLPDGARVTAMDVYFKDASTSSNGWLYFSRSDGGSYSGVLTSVATAGSSGVADSRGVSGLNLLVNQSSYAYSVDWVVGIPGDALQICGFRLTYIPPGVPGDVNADTLVNVSDVFYLINYLFAAGPAPV